MRTVLGFRQPSRASEEDDKEERVGLTAGAKPSPTTMKLRRPIVTVAKQAEMDKLAGFPPGAKEFVSALLQHKDRLVSRGMVQAAMFGPGPLGLFIADVGPLVLVAAFENPSNTQSATSTSTQAAAGQAEVLGQIAPGDQIVSVNGRKCYGLGVNKVCRLMAVAKRPVCIEYIKMVVAASGTTDPQEPYRDAAHESTTTTAHAQPNSSRPTQGDETTPPEANETARGMALEPAVSERPNTIQRHPAMASVRTCDSCQANRTRKDAKFCWNCGSPMV